MVYQRLCDFVIGSGGCFEWSVESLSGVPGANGGHEAAAALCACCRNAAIPLGGSAATSRVLLLC
jgi:hypothetical protein